MVGGGNPLAGHLSLSLVSANTVMLLPTSVVNVLLSLKGTFFPGLETLIEGLRGSINQLRKNTLIGKIF